MAEQHWQIQLFGGLRAQQGEKVVTHFETRKIAALFGCLALRLHHPQPREVLAEQLWPDEDWEATRKRLRQGLSSLRQTLEPGGKIEGSVLLADRSEAWLNPEAVTTDVEEFEAVLAAAAVASGPEKAAPLLGQAVALYQGELLPGYYEEWIASERERLVTAYQDALGRLAKALAEAGDLCGAIQTGRRLVAADPLREDGHASLMRFYAAAGRPSEAVRQYRELESVLREELGTAPSTATRTLLQELRDTPTFPLSAPCFAETQPTLARPSSPALSADLEPEGGAVPLGSPFYLVRPTDEEFHAAIARRDSIVLVKGPRQIGKTSLLARGLQQARNAGASVTLTDLQKLDPEQLESAAALFRTLAEMIIDQLDLEICVEEAWNPRRGWNVNFERFLRREVLGTLDSPLVWALDEVDRLFACSFSNVVFGLFRSWHNERALNPEGPWGRLTLAIAYATEAHLFITDLNQSPFNVGTRLTLEDFTRGEVAELNRRYGSPLRDGTEIGRYFDLVGGHPYLVRRGLRAMAEHRLDLAALEKQSDSDEGIFGDHLGRMLAALTQNAELCDAFQSVARGKPCPAAASFYRLRSAGVLAGNSPAQAFPRCRLYSAYLQQHLP